MAQNFFGFRKRFLDCKSIHQILFLSTKKVEAGGSIPCSKDIIHTVDSRKAIFHYNQTKKLAQNARQGARRHVLLLGYGSHEL